MTTLRFDFQRECVERTLDGLDFAAALEQPDRREGDLIVNIGCNDDPAHLKAIDPARVVNCDLFERDAVLDRPNVVDVTFDCASERWPFEDGAAALIVLGDILEHLSPGEIAFTLREARRVSRSLCITVPEDRRDDVGPERADLYPRGAVHRTTVTRAMLEELLEDAGWKTADWREVLYDDGTFWGQRTMGHFVSAE